MSGRHSVAAVRVRTTDAARTGAFLGLLGFVAGDDGALVVPDGAPVAVELDVVTVAPVAPAGFDRGPRALDVYTNDMDAVLAELVAAGWPVSGPGTVSVGPVTMRQALVVGPDGLPVVLVESTHRRSSLLDEHPERRCSEPHSVVWCVDDLDAEAARWAAAGWTLGPVLSFSEPAVSDYLGLPRSPVPIRMVMIADESVAPVRLELLEFADDAGGPLDAAAIAGLVLYVPDPGPAGAALGLEAGRTPAGIGVELRDAT
ncbi:MAG: VOC family protein [Actinomycetes bacterium]